MGLSDIDARFDQVKVAPGTLAEVVVRAARDAARTVNDAAGTGESTELMSVVQYLELAAHTAGRFMNYPVTSADGPEDTALEDMDLEQLKQAARGRKLTVSGTKEELRERITEHDSRRVDEG
jgi:hypothetical protein